ncbi:MAG: hypothetical protein P4M15_11970 [Alphaproteobacteria bacterium]|nr:hypothetical protein [Alphaproteobacteria bacterium]
MSHISMILSAVMLAAFVIAFAPGIIGLNRGHVLRNIALWLGIFLALALFYKSFGPESAHPLFSAPAGITAVKPAPDAKDQPDAPPADKDGKDEGSQGFTPPSD